MGAWDKIWSKRLATDGDAGGTAAAALWWLSDMSVAVSDWGGSKVGKGGGTGEGAGGVEAGVASPGVCLGDRGLAGCGWNRG